MNAISKKPLNEIVPEYNSRFIPVKKYFWDRIKYSVILGRLKNGYKILDVGCGIGYLLEEVQRRHNCECYGIDTNVNIKNLSIPDCTFEVSDVARLTFADKFFDVVFAMDTLEHIENCEPAIKQIHRVLKDDGSLIVVGPTETFFYKLCRFMLKGTFSEEGGPGAGEHHHTIYTLEKIITAMGFTAEKKLYLPRYFPTFLSGVKIIRYRKTN
ncbi:MAG: hypothetical protein A2252_03130 [Elusimicrobia bacterium RIFOXYA2_FULL_39_19]|nr:MAG: hypothetical protein A2252_03130 [Elusimicrobia bacterium RIFOXYA2_FULL_39_19]